MALSSPACMAGRAGDRGYPCPCCGYMVFGGPPGSYEICPICFWEDDAVELEFATSEIGGANALPLARAQSNYARIGACDPRSGSHVRPPRGDEPRDPLWRPVDAERDVFEDIADPARARAPANDETLYYWRPAFWRLRPATRESA